MRFVYILKQKAAFVMIWLLVFRRMLFRSKLQDDPGKISLAGTKIVMELPRLNGFTTDSRPYELTARAAAQDLTKPEVLELKDISAVVELKDGQRVTIKSINGVYDTKGEMLRLNDHITLNSTSGYEGRLS